MIKQAMTEFAETTVQCPRCKRTVDIMEIVDAGLLHEGAEEIGCINCKPEEKRRGHE